MLPQDLATATTSQVTPQVIIRGLIRHWWQILLLWLAVSAPLAYLIFLFIEPIYQATSLIRVEPAAPHLFASSRSNETSGTAGSYLQTQVQVIMSDQVLGAAVANPTVSILSTIKNSLDPKTDLRKNLIVRGVEDAFLIRVALESKDAGEAATIVNAVVESYRLYNERYTLSANMNLRKVLEKEQSILKTKIEAVHADLKALLDQGRVSVPSAKDILIKRTNDDDSTQPTFNNLGEEHFKGQVADMLRTDMELIDVEANLTVLEQALQTSKAEAGHQGLPADEGLNALIEEEFKKDPEVVGVIGEITDANEQFDHAKGKARQSNDPSVIAVHKHRGKLMDKYEKLWEIKYKEILERLRDKGGADPLAVNERALRFKFNTLKTKKEMQTKKFEQMKFENKVANTDSLQSGVLNHELASLQAQKDSVTDNLAQLAFESNQEAFRIVLVDPAAIPVTPSNNKRLKLMAAAPVGVLFVIFGLFMLLEIKAERIADPDALSTRVQSKVYSLPPLPTARSMRKLSVPDADDQIEQFIQRLDHLRFGVCGTSVEMGKGRCVLITSAIGGEGKTTLAAQLAARCGNAGMSTILIDADLRRAALCVLLDVAEGPGLSDVLKNEARVEDVVIPVQGGTFVLLPAGTPLQDTSRILQSRKVGELIAQLRQVYDLIILDSPPILPVPDALILGRWADGAVLAARYDISRFPQVERARRQLDSAGIAVLGTVINGMRNSDSYTGGYAYTKRRSSTSDTV
jgi:polysaccharide biosynthesis transport protein